MQETHSTETRILMTRNGRNLKKAHDLCSPASTEKNVETSKEKPLSHYSPFHPEALISRGRYNAIDYNASGKRNRDRGRRTDRMHDPRRPMAPIACDGDWWCREVTTRGKTKKRQIFASLLRDPATARVTIQFIHISTASVPSGCILPDHHRRIGPA